MTNVNRVITYRADSLNFEACTEFNLDFWNVSTAEMLQVRTSVMLSLLLGLKGMNEAKKVFTGA